MLVSWATAAAYLPLREGKAAVDYECLCIIYTESGNEEAAEEVDTALRWLSDVPGLRAVQVETI